MAGDNSGNFAVVSLVLKMVRQALPAVMVATIIPLGLFYIVLLSGSVQWAIGASVIYAWAMVAWQYLRHRQVSGLLVVTWLTATLRAALALVSGHPFIYFALPAAETAAFGLVFVATLARAEPLLIRLVRDLLPAGADLLAANRPLIRNLSLLWGVSHLLSAVATMLLLLTTPLPVFLAVHVFANWLFIGSAGGLSMLLARSRDRNLLGEVVSELRRSTASIPIEPATGRSAETRSPRPAGMPVHREDPGVVPTAA